jgi:hypothetical protein
MRTDFRARLEGRSPIWYASHLAHVPSFTTPVDSGILGGRDRAGWIGCQLTWSYFHDFLSSRDNRHENLDRLFRHRMYRKP